MRRRSIVLLAAFAPMAVALPANASPSYRIANGSDSGQGSLRDALESGQSPIVIAPGVGEIEISDTLVWDEAAELVILGSGATIVGPSSTSGDAFLLVTQGADVSITNLHFSGTSDFSVDNPGGKQRHQSRRSGRRDRDRIGGSEQRVDHQRGTPRGPHR